jgi:hypothetical protein
VRQCSGAFDMIVTGQEKTRGQTVRMTERETTGSASFIRGRCVRKKLAKKPKKFA